MDPPDAAAWLDVLCERQRLDLIGDLMGGLAHELNNALSVVTGHQDLLLEALDTDVESRRELQARAQTMHTWTGTALAVARRLHDVSRQMRESEGPAVAAAVVSEGVELCRYRCERERILLVADIDTGTARVDLPPGQLLQAVVNLVQNAREAIGRAAQQSGGDEGGTIRVSTEADGEGLRVVVEDDGPGVAVDDVERIFAPGAGTKQAPACGYGLAVSRHIARRCGGDLRAAAGDGGRFVLELPRYR